VLNNIVVLERDLEGAFAVLRQVRELETSMHELAPEICLALSSLWLEADVDYTLSNLPGLLRRTREGLGRIQGIVKDLRVFARVEEDQFLEADIHQGIESTVHILMGNAKARGVAIELDLASIPRVFCQPAKLNQVIMNLVSNAIEASKEGGRVVVSTRPHPRGIAIEVLDEGFGIEPDVRDRIFDPFFTTKPIGEGTGLGLSISYGIVKEHGGTIDVSSQPGQGARFTVILPVHRSTDGQTGNQPMYPRERDMLAVGGRVEAPR
jgi:signal transduction histidine kinase